MSASRVETITIGKTRTAKVAEAQSNAGCPKSNPVCNTLSRFFPMNRIKIPTRIIQKLLEGTPARLLIDVLINLVKSESFAYSFR